jgi:hypothetical protein
LNVRSHKKGALHELGTAIFQASLADSDGDHRPFSDCLLESIKADYQAIENGFVMIRPTGNDLPPVIDPLGRVLASLPTRGVTTRYSRVSDAFAYLCVTGLILLTGQALLRGEQPVVVAQRWPA